MTQVFFFFFLQVFERRFSADAFSRLARSSCPLDGDRVAEKEIMFLDFEDYLYVTMIVFIIIFIICCFHCIFLGNTCVIR